MHLEAEIATGAKVQLLLAIDMNDSSIDCMVFDCLVDQASTLKVDKLGMHNI